MKTPHPNILIVGQSGRLAAEAVLFCATLRAASPGFEGRVFVAEPQPGPLWPSDPRIGDPDTYRALERLGADLLPFTSHHFGAAYPNGNKVEALLAMPPGPFLFFDTDTVVTGPLEALSLDPARPTASMARTDTWPVIELYGPGYTQTWAALYDRLGLDFEASLDLTKPDEHWQRYLYFNAGWFLGPDPQDFGARMIEVMRMVRDDPPQALVCQPIYPWLDQIALPLVIHALGGGRPDAALDGLDSTVTRHYRALPLFYATATDAQIALVEQSVQPNWIKKVLKAHAPFHRTLLRGDGEKARAAIPEADRGLPDQTLRRRLKKLGLWHR